MSDRSICFYFQVHQPFRLKTYRFFNIGTDPYYFDEYNNRYIMRKVAEKCYLPTNQTMLDLIKEFGSAFKISYSISGTAFDQFEMYAPDVLDSFKRLADTGCVEFIAETYSHSLSALKSKEEFFSQVQAQVKKVKQHFGQTPTTFRNTELIYADFIGEMVAEMGFKTMLTEGAKQILGWKSPNFMYCNAINPKLKILLKNFQLSDDIAFRFSQNSWGEWPLTTEKYVDWLNMIDTNQKTVNLFMDYETFGEHQWADSGIFEFLKALPGRVLSHSNFKFRTPSEVSNILQPVSAINIPHPISWADEERDLTAWLGNDLQDEAFNNLYALEHKIKQIDDNDILRDWKYLQTSDHFYYMCTKWFSDGDVHKYFNPYNSPYEAFINFMNILSDFIIRVDKQLEYQKSNNTLSTHEFIKKEEKSKNVKVDKKETLKKPLKKEIEKVAKTEEVKKAAIINKKVEETKKSDSKATSKKEKLKKIEPKEEKKTKKVNEKTTNLKKAFFSIKEFKDNKLKKGLANIDFDSLFNIYAKSDDETRLRLEKNMNKISFKLINNKKNEFSKVKTSDYQEAMELLAQVINLK